MFKLCVAALCVQLQNVKSIARFIFMVSFLMKCSQSTLICGDYKSII